MDTPGKELALYSPVGSGGELSGLDARLLDIVAEAGGRISGEEIAKKLNVESMTPARCAQRVREILKSQDLLSQVEQKALILLDFIKVRDMLFDRIEGTETRITKHGDVIEVESSPGLFNTMVRMLKEWRLLIESMRQDVDSETVKIRAAHARIMMDAIVEMFEEFIRLLEQFFIDKDRLPTRIEMNEMMEEAMPFGFQALERKTAA
jgi:DNA-binding Lrp family transcriptional regulator